MRFYRIIFFYIKCGRIDKYLKMEVILYINKKKKIFHLGKILYRFFFKSNSIFIKLSFTDYYFIFVP